MIGNGGAGVVYPGGPYWLHHKVHLKLPRCQLIMLACVENLQYVLTNNCKSCVWMHASKLRMSK